MTLPNLTSPRIVRLAIIIVVLAPLAYLIGRYTEPSTPAGWLRNLATTSWLTALGALIGIPAGLVLGLRRQPAAAPAAPSAELLAELRAELTENQQLFLARKGSATLVARLGYVSTYWDSLKNSAALVSAVHPHALSQIGLAYYWLAQANHLETLAYDAKNGGVARDPEFTTAKLISEVRLLDEPIEKALTAALNAIA